MIRRLFPFLLFLFWSQSSFAQDISYQGTNKSITHILGQIEKQHGFYFGYSIAELKGLKTSIDVEKVTIDSFLDLLLSETELVYEVLENNFIAIHKASSVFISATLRDEENNDPLAFATVRLKGSNLGSIADDQGNVHLVIKKPTNVVLQFSFLGYDTQEIDLRPSPIQQSLAIKLKATATSLGSVIVKEYLNTGIVSNDMAGSFRVYPKEMEILPGLVERDPLLSTQIIAGVNSNGESATRINVRGSSPENTFTYWNNIPIYQSGHYFGTISNFIPAAVSEIGVYKNFIPIEYDGPSAGLIDLKSTPSTDALSQFGASINMTHADAFANFSFDKSKGAILVSARRSFNDLLVTPTYDAYSEKLFDGNVIQDGQGGQTTSETLNQDVNFHDINFKGQYALNEKLELSLSAFQTTNKLIANTTADLTQTSLNQEHNAKSYGVNNSLNFKIKTNWISDLSLSYTDYDMSYNFLNQRTDDDDDSDDDIQSRANRVKNFQLRWTNKFLIASNQLMRFGYQLDRFDVKNTFSSSSFLEEDFEDVFESSGLGNSLYGEYIIDISEKLELMAGLRLTLFSTLEEIGANPQIRANYKLSNEFTLKASYGHYNQYLRAIEETEYTLSNSIEQYWVLADDDETIPLSTNKQLAFGFMFSQDGWMLDVDVFNKNLDGLLARNLGFNVSNQAGFAQGKEQLIGIDLTLRKRWKNMRTWVSYGFQDSKTKFNSIYDNEFPSSLNIRHQLQLAMTVNVKPFEFSLGYIFKTGLPYSEVAVVSFVEATIDGDDDDEGENDEDESDSQSYYQIEYDNPNGNRLPNYHRLDFSAWYKFKSKGKLGGEIGLSLINIFDRKNTFNRSYSVELDELNQPIIVERDRFLLGFTPNLSIRINF